MSQLISVVVSVYNEQESLFLFWDAIKYLLQPEGQETRYEIVFVNDGSTDASASILDSLVLQSDCVRVVHFSRNFGHEAAMLAGICHAKGDAVICMDSDLQHPPTILPDMVARFSQGDEVVTMVCNRRADGGLRKRITSKFFYWIINKLSDGQFEPNASDFFLISKRVAQIVTTSYPERTRFLRGLIQSVGFQKSTIEFEAPARVAGKSKYSLTKLFFFSLSAIASFSHVPLRLGVALGFIFGMLSLLVGFYSLVMKFLGEPFSGYTTLVVLLSFGFSLLFIVVGIIGEYLGYIFNEVKHRPPYIVDRVEGKE